MAPRAPRGKGLAHEAGFRFVKMLDISYTTVILFFVGFFLANALDKVLPKFDEEKAEKRHVGYVIGEAVGMVCLTAVLLYVSRNLVALIPSPFEGFFGFEHGRIKELTGAPILAFALNYYQTNLQERLKYLYKKF